jgi:hypothetical protein
MLGPKIWKSAPKKIWSILSFFRPHQLFPILSPINTLGLYNETRIAKFEANIQVKNSPRKLSNFGPHICSFFLLTNYFQFLIKSTNSFSN